MPNRSAACCWNEGKQVPPHPAAHGRHPLPSERVVFLTGALPRAMRPHSPLGEGCFSYSRASARHETPPSPRGEGGRGTRPDEGLRQHCSGEFTSPPESVAQAPKVDVVALNLRARPERRVSTCRPVRYCSGSLRPPTGGGNTAATECGGDAAATGNADGRRSPSPCGPMHGGEDILLCAAKAPAYTSLASFQAGCDYGSCAAGSGEDSLKRLAAQSCAK